MRHCARGDREIEQGEEIGEPQCAADRRCVFDRLLDRLEIVGLLSDRREIRWDNGQRPRRRELGAAQATCARQPAGLRRRPSPDALPAERANSAPGRRDRSTIEVPCGYRHRTFLHKKRASSNGQAARGESTNSCLAASFVLCSHLRQAAPGTNAGACRLAAAEASAGRAAPVAGRATIGATRRGRKVSISARRSERTGNGAAKH